MNHDSPYRGSCLCGAVRYEVDHLEPRMAHCHCIMSRKFHGAAHSTYGEARVENFRWTRGEDDLESYIAANNTTRRFCRICGASMTYAPASGGEGLIEFSLGTLDTPIVERPDVHVFMDFKADWSEENDALPKFAEGRDSVPYE